MKKTYKIIITTICFISLFTNTNCNKESLLGEQPEEITNNNSNCQIEVKVTGFTNTDGELAIAVFNNSNAFENKTKAYIDSTTIITQSELTIILNNIDPGNYAISVFHDEDENGNITFGGFLNLIPQEGFGFSNNPDIGMSQPSFQDCQFTIEDGQQLLVPIILNYL